MTDKLVSHEYRPGEELVLRLSVTRLKRLPSPANLISRSTIKAGLTVVRNLVDAAIDYLEQSEEEPEPTASQTKLEQPSSDVRPHETSSDTP
ncbi:MAG: hypothetical protein V3R87_11905 [Dehalococcoidia bacterium]